MTDLELHNQTSTLSPASIGDLAASIQNEHSLFPVVPGTNWELRFGHFVGYGSTYYSYLYADVLAEDIWKRFFAGDSLAPGAGESLRDKLLRHGGSRDPELLVREVLGSDALYEVGGGFRPRV
jgi:intermediate peptidase